MMKTTENTASSVFGFYGPDPMPKPSKKLDHAQLVAVCDINEGAVLNLRQRTWQPIVQQMICWQIRTINTVIIAVPNQLHLEMVHQGSESA